MMRMSCSAARRTSWSKPSKSGSEDCGVSDWTPAQYIGSLTLRTSLLSISSKSLSPVGPWGAMPAKGPGTRAAAEAGAEGGERQHGGEDRERAFHRWGVIGVVSEIIVAAFGAWRSLVARTVRVGEVPGSNPGAPIS